MNYDPKMVPEKNVSGQFHPRGNRPLMAMIEVTNRCNMACPICYSDAGPKAADVPLHKISDYLTQLLAVTETPIPIQISGGEPTLRDDLADIIAMTRDLGFSHIELITNGIRISRDMAFLERLKEAGLSAVYLQFDGLTAQTSLKIRGRDMSRIRQRAVDAIAACGLCCTLAVVVTRGINENEIGSIVKYAVDHVF